MKVLVCVVVAKLTQKLAINCVDLCECTFYYFQTKQKYGSQVIVMRAIKWCKISNKRKYFKHEILFNETKPKNNSVRCSVKCVSVHVHDLQGVSWPVELHTKLNTMELGNELELFDLDITWIHPKKKHTHPKQWNSHIVL